MSPPLSPRRLLRESLPVVAILAVWAAVARLALLDVTRQALLVAGLVMAGLYVFVRGAALAESASPAGRSAGLVDVLRENGWLLAVAGVWFVTAHLFAGLVLLAEGVAPFARAVPGTEVVAFVFNGTGVGTVVLYAVAVGRARVAAGGPRRDGRPDDGDVEAPASDGPADATGTP